MQKSKKLLSVLLAMLMGLSVMSAGLVADAQSLNRQKTFAAEAKVKDAAVSAVESKINAYTGDMNTATPADEDQAGYDALIAAFQGLTDGQKDSIDPFALDKLTQLMYTHYRAVNGTSSAVRKEAAKFILETLRCPALDEAQAAIDAGLLSSGKSADDLMNLYKGLSPLARMMSGTAYSSYGLFYYGLAATGTGTHYYNNTFYNIVNKVWGDIKKADPYPGKAPAASAYPDGRNDPQYIADYRAYYTEKYAYEANNLKKAILQVADGCEMPNLKNVAAYLDMGVEAMQAFEANKDYKKAVEADAYYNALDFETQYAILGIRCTAYATYAGKNEITTSPTTVTLSNFPAKIADYAQYEMIVEFESYIADVKAPYTVEAAQEAREKYDALPASLLGALSEETAAKIDEITYWLLTNNPSTEKPDVSDYNKTKVTYPNGAAYEQTTEAIPKMDTLVNEVVKAVAGSDLKTLVSDELYTNETLLSIHKAIGPMLGTLGIDGDVNPSGLLKYIATQDENGNWVSNYPQWNGAVAALARVAADTNSWDDVVYVNGDWFKDGDKQGFCDAFPTILMVSYNLKKIINVGEMLFNSLQFENKYDFAKNEYKTGTYENLVHIFEAVGIDCRDSVTYTENFNAQTNDTDRMIARISPILFDVFTFVEKFADTPVTTLTEILPNVARVLNEGIIDENVQEIIGRISGLLGIAGVTLPTLDFTAEGLFDTLGGLGIDGITFEEQKNSAGEVAKPNQGTLYIRITLVEEEQDSNGNVVTPGQYTTLAIKEADFLQFLNEVEGCGKLTVADSICVNNAYRPYIVSDKADTFVTTVRFIYDDVLMTNKDSVKEIVNVANPQVGQILGPVLDVMAQYLPADAAIVALVNIANPYEPTVPDVTPSEGSGIRDILNRILTFIGDKIKNVFDPADSTENGGSTAQTDAPSIPKTGGQVAVSLFSLAAAAAFAGGAILYKKKAEEE